MQIRKNPRPGLLDDASSLVTGATSGVGARLAIEAPRRRHVILSGRNRQSSTVCTMNRGAESPHPPSRCWISRRPPPSTTTPRQDHRRRVRQARWPGPHGGPLGRSNALGTVRRATVQGAACESDGTVHSDAGLAAGSAQIGRRLRHLRQQRGGANSRPFWGRMQWRKPASSPCAACWRRNSKANPTSHQQHQPGRMRTPCAPRPIRPKIPIACRHPLRHRAFSLLAERAGSRRRRECRRA